MPRQFARRVEKNIYDYGNLLMVQISRNCERTTKCFVVSTYGGRRKALKAAIEWRDKCRANLPPKRPPRIRPATKAPSTSSSGILGVSRRSVIQTTNRKDGTRSYLEEYWQARARKDSPHSAAEVPALSEGDGY